VFGMNRGPIEIEPFDHNQVFLQKAHIVIHVFLVQLGRLGRVLGRFSARLSTCSRRARQAPRLCLDSR